MRRAGCEERPPTPRITTATARGVARARARAREGPPSSPTLCFSTPCSPDRQALGHATPTPDGASVWQLAQTPTRCMRNVRQGHDGNWCWTSGVTADVNRHRFRAQRGDHEISVPRACGADFIGKAETRKRGECPKHAALQDLTVPRPDKVRYGHLYNESATQTAQACRF